MNKQHIRRFLDASTAHVSPQTRDWLDHEGEIAADVGGEWTACTPKLHIARHRFGWLFYADHHPDDEIPGDVRNLMALAREHGCDYVLLDADADTIDSLPTYDW